MPDGFKKRYPALRHAAYSATTILPGENAAEFEKLHKGLIAEYSPEGPSEEDNISTMAHLIWRKQHLNTFRIADLARSRYDEIRSKILGDPSFLLTSFGPTVDPADREAAVRAIENQIKKEVGDAYALVELGDAATVDGLMKDLEVQERLDAMIEKCLKRLLMVRGVKSLSIAPSSGPAKRLAAPSKAA